MIIGEFKQPCRTSRFGCFSLLFLKKCFYYESFFRFRDFIGETGFAH